MDPVSTVQVAAAGQMGRLVDLLPVGYALGAGMMSAVNPCGFALLPTYLALFMGAREDAFAQRSLAQRLGRALVVSAAVSLGFVLLFGVIGALVSAGARMVIGWMPWISLAIGSGLVLLGAAMLAGRHPGAGFLLRLGSRTMRPGAGGVGTFFLYGTGFGICSVSCTLPIFLVVMGSALAAGGALDGMLQFVSYGVGMSAVITVLTVSVAFLKQGLLVAGLRRAMPHLHLATAVLVLFAGAYIMYYWLIKGDLLG